jgi:hypothetical protein
MKDEEGRDREEERRLLEQGRRTWAEAEFVLNAIRGREVKEAAAKGGREKAKAAGRPSIDQLKQAMAAFHEEHPNVLWSRACKRVGDACGLARSTVTDKLRGTEADWRTRQD